MVLNISIFILISIFLPPATPSAAVDRRFEACRRPMSCDDGQTIQYPFHIEHRQQKFCGYPGFKLKCHQNGHPILHLSGRDLVVRSISYETHSLRLSDDAVLTASECRLLIGNLSLFNEPFHLADGQGEICSSDERRRAAERNGLVMKWTAGECSFCNKSGGFCGFDYSTHFFKCYCPDRPHALRCNPPSPPDKSRMSLWIGLGVGVLGVNLLMLLFALWYCKKRRAAPTMLTRNISCEPYSKFDLEDGGVCFEVPVFSYGELEMATNKFDRDKELGDGGFGTVYHGKLLDGREVAVKRLYQHNYRRVEQFMNEVKILTRLRHKNLVSLYGCTSKRSRELLLVYEFVANGTVADHLHGEQASFSLLTWPIRMTIAIETASALVYLHASDIIHRDVKTTNILLDSNFSVKVADFGLSRLFPNDVSHVSTAPQGTPGYVDPEYYQCYQLTTKSDVYSFGVVLIELISSMPAVDITRHRHEINLSNLAVDKILRQEIDELIDPCLGYQSDEKVRRMILAVAWLAFLCLQQDKERRPTMEEALETLKRIESGEENENLQDNSALSKSYDPAPSPEYDEVELLKNKRQQLLSPTSVADKWISSTSFVSASTSLSSIS
ncbi:LEAF RUST 10 DISEASE-RESISTANCE LOCUS RECEPTOR-LIKE PROTEIN KINASE-like 1.2 isoform X2 [Cucurbita pepo subsp. pepo]|uniref:LEAF RUST 10 DISEASE-RESISTANCE LOCUS RECEPTOR-LIKE PROTEIN KINASE-like 1.2 isoform X2 n=1 Tax=Cucurbita pepo subsp. pepo TaxID=3664 RepID=UPI000C9D9460|nr:LEAF RUST 10 DISEASE-RESISTANCE LOCUS RECEPTOR-LIKE PROTEIN KINASE-like 1.2 isoform X2 [Cucurbita pepo subsp. pepo]